MELLRKNNWIVNLALMFLTQGLYIFVLAHLMKLYDKNAWYCKWQYWVFGTVCLIFPVFIMLYVFQIQMLCKIASNLEVPGSEIYNSPYTWIICLIIPLLGWSLMIVMIIYIQLFMIVNLYKGYGEKFIPA